MLKGTMISILACQHSGWVSFTVLLSILSVISAQLQTDYDAVGELSPSHCTGCATIFGGSVVLVGTQMTVSDHTQIAAGKPATRTQPCSWAAGVDTNGNFALSDCSGFPDPNGNGSLILTMDDGQPLGSVTMLSTIFDVYTSLGTLIYNSSCVLVTTVKTLASPVTIAASEATITPVVTTGEIFTATIESQRLPNSGISTRFPSASACSTPAPYLERPAFTTALPSVVSPSSASSIVSGESFGLSRESRIVLGITGGLSVLMILIGLTFAIWQRFPSRKDTKNTRSHSVEQFSSIPGEAGRGIYSKVPAQTGHSKSNIDETGPGIWVWRSPSLMLSGLICGLVLAVGHHYLYQSINGYPVTEIQLSQTWYLRFGNLLAVLVKLSFATSVAASFVQLQWLRLRQVDLRVKDIDALSNALFNIFSLLESIIWLRFPALALLALIFWLLALTPIVTPGTLNVKPLLFHNKTLVQVPQLNFSDYTQWTNTQSSTDGTLTVAGSIAMRQVVRRTAIGGQVLSFTTGVPNGSWHLDFEGPALKCIDATEAMRQDYEMYCDTGFETILYLSRVAQSLDLKLSPAGAVNDYKQNPLTLDTESQDYCRIFVTNCGGREVQQESSTQSATPSVMNVTECGLYNARYSVDFSFHGLDQTITIQGIDFMDGVSWLKYEHGTWNTPSNVSTPQSLSTEMVQYNQMGSYLGLMAELGSLLVGRLEGYPTGKLVSHSKFTSVELLAFDYATLTQRDGQNKLEELFQNLTLSLLSRGAFLKNSTTADWIEVQDEFDQVSYFYDSFDLILTYSLAFFGTTLSVLIGFYAFSLNQGSYQNRFSTFIRATNRDHKLRSRIDGNDRAADPRPKALVEARVKIMR